ncbi:MAG: tetratricopeptide repeat protein [Treponema sp.]|jgi:tetratricopeptide (TPR) repeat protein|nr:tetratricopeptide repeat protein [Treponema sp.]
MPSLNALGKFKFSFNNIASEKSIVISRGQNFDDLVLPETEAAPIDDTPPPPSGEAAPDQSPFAGDFDFSAFFNTLPNDTGPPPIDDVLPDDDFPAIPEDEAAAVETSPVDDASTDGMSEDSMSADGISDDSMSVPDELLSGLSDGFDTAPTDLGSEDTAGEDFGSGLDTNELPDFDLPDSVPDGTSDGTTDTENFDLNTDDFDMGEGLSSGSGADEGVFDIGNELPDFDLPDGTTDGVSGGDFDLNTDDFDTGEGLSGGSGTDADVFDIGNDLPDFDLPDGTTDGTSDGVSSGDFDLNTDDFDMGGETPVPDGDLSDFSDFDISDAVPGSDFDSPLPGDDFSSTETSSDNFNMGELSDFNIEDLGGSPETGSMEEGGAADTAKADEDAGGVDFSLPGLDEIFDKAKPVVETKPVVKKSLWSRIKDEGEPEPEAEADIEEIQLSQKDMDKLLKTLSSYPLNLRIICEELIAEQVLEPQQLLKLVRLLVTGAPVKETAALAEQISGKTIVIPRSFEKSTGAAFEAEQSTFAYIFVHNFLPVLRLFAVIAALAASLVYLGYKFIYTPAAAESLYKRGYERIPAGEYQRANELFQTAFGMHRKKNWFYLYAEAFRDERRYMLAEEKYDELLQYYPRDKKGVLDYASLETNYLLNYDKANRILQHELIDYAPNDMDGLLAMGDNNLAWGDSDPSRYADKYEDARFAYARVLEKYGWKPPVVERMMKYFIRTDDLKEVLILKDWFEYSTKEDLSPTALAEIGGYLLDKQLEEVKGVPNEYLESIDGVRDMLIRAVRQNLTLPEPHYHLARYYNSLGNIHEERLTLENAIRAFAMAKDESVRRRLYRVDAHYRYANLLINNREFFPAEEQLVRGIELYEDFLSRNLIGSSPLYGKLYAARGDLEYFVKSGNMRAALNYYHRAEQNNWSPPEVQYRMGAAYYQLEDWKNALEHLFRASTDLPLNRRLLFALGNTTFKRGDYFAAQGYYNRLLDILESQRSRLPVLLPNDRPEFLELGERLMMARNNAGVTYEALADQTGSRDYRSRALILYAESSRAWDSITRNPGSMERLRPADTPGAPGVNLGFLNANNTLHAVNGQRTLGSYKPEIFIRIDKEVLESSRWEELAPLSGGLQN